jgi:hypothetical protein
MASAASLALEEFRRAQRCVKIRQRLYDRFDQWLDTLAARVEEPQPILEELDPSRHGLCVAIVRAVL